VLREGGNHSFWGFDAERSTAVPRRREIDFRLAQKICADLRIPPPAGIALTIDALRPDARRFLMVGGSQRLLAESTG